jgi:hypothetical protein
MNNTTSPSPTNHSLSIYIGAQGPRAQPQFPHLQHSQPGHDPRMLPQRKTRASNQELPPQRSRCPKDQRRQVLKAPEAPLPATSGEASRRTSQVASSQADSQVSTPSTLRDRSVVGRKRVSVKLAANLWLPRVK